MLEQVDAERQAVAERLLEETRVSESLQRVSAMLAAETDTHRLVQVVTDEATSLTGAAFGAFFYNVVDEGEMYTLYTISGVERSVFESYPMPRNTEIFGPTFRGEGVIRLDDVTRDPRYGQNPPYNGMPDGHLPVRSYLAAPVISRTGEVLGGLFFGHGQPAVFRERDERLVLGIAHLAAIAIDNAQLVREAQGARAQYGYLFDGIADAILMANETGRYIDANMAAEQLLGYRRDELLGLSVADLVANQPDWTAHEWERFQRDGIWTGELDLRHNDGHPIPVEVRASRVELPDRVIFASVLRDISARRKVEKMQREFTTLVTHELKAPLTSLKGFAQLLQRRREYDAGAVEVILGRTSHLERLINDLLDVASGDSGALRLRKSRIDLVTIVGRNVELARATTSMHEIRLTAPREPILGWWDSGRLNQILQNVLQNAIKFSPFGGAIEVTISSDGDDGVVTVTDQGIGIPPSALPHIFDRFYRVEVVERASVQGLGIGLYITKMLVEAHGGTIVAKSRPGVGSTIRFSLPLSQ